MGAGAGEKERRMEPHSQTNTRTDTNIRTDGRFNEDWLTEKGRKTISQTDCGRLARHKTDRRTKLETVNRGDSGDRGETS